MIFYFPGPFPNSQLLSIKQLLCLIGFSATSEIVYFNLGTEGNDYKYSILITCRVDTISEKLFTFFLSCPFESSINILLEDLILRY